jgi:hypothetical protein
MAGFSVNLLFSFSKYVLCRGTVTRFELPPLLVVMLKDSYNLKLGAKR